MTLKGRLPFPPEASNPAGSRHSTCVLSFPESQTLIAKQAIMKSTVGILLVFLSSMVHAAEPLPDMKPLLGERGDVIFSESFDGPDAVPLRVIRNTKSEIAEGGVRLGTIIERPEWGHGGIAFVYGMDRPALEDFILEADFRWDVGQSFGFQFPRLREEGEPAHGIAPEFFIRFRRPKDATQPGHWDIRDNAPEAAEGKHEANSAAKLDAKGRVPWERVTVGEHEATFPPGQWHRVMIEVRNDEVAVQLSNGQSLRGKCNKASSPKMPPQIGTGPDGSEAIVDNITISAFR